MKKNNMLNITIGCNTYCGSSRIINLFKNITKAVDFDKYIITRVLIDDGSSQKDSNLLKHICDIYHFGYVKNEENKGIPYCWNTICNINDKADIVFIFNDDIELVNPNWLKCASYFIQNNDNIGTVGFPNIRTYDYVLTDYEKVPSQRLYSNGSGFAINMNAYKSTSGFWNDLVSFYEEIDMGMQLNKLGYYCFQIPFPFLFHRQGQTFDENSEILLYRKESNYLCVGEYISMNNNSDYKYSLFKNNVDSNNINRMNYARSMFAKKWGLSINETNEINLSKFIKRYNGKIKYLDFDYNKQTINDFIL